MNIFLQNIFSKWFDAGGIPPEHERGPSSIAGTELFRKSLINVIQKYQISSIFDAGCQDACWAHLLQQHVTYIGGDISPSLIQSAKASYPAIEFHVHDITEDSFPDVDMLMVRDVAIHLSNKYKLMLLQNWMRSDIPWLLITQEWSCADNQDIIHGNDFPWQPVNWRRPPWNFPEPVERLDDIGIGSGRMSLWHKDQIATLDINLDH